MRHACPAVLAFLLLGAAGALSEESGPYTLRRLRPTRGFGTSGVVSEVRAVGGRLDRLRAIRIDGEGRLVVAGEALRLTEATDFDPAPRPGVARFLDDGRLDASFGAGGVVQLPLEGYVSGLEIDGQDRIVVAGRFTDLAGATSPITVAARLLPDGDLDRTFGADGFAEHAGANPPRLNRIAIDPRDEALLGVGSGAVWRLRSEGYLDPDYGVDGAAAVAPGALDLAVDPSGRAIVASGDQVIRLTPDGDRDLAFGDGGVLRGPLGGVMGAHSLALDETGRIVLRGYENGVSRGLYRFLADGAADESFGVGGMSAIPFAIPGDCEAPDPRIVASRGPQARYALAGTVHRMGRDLSSSRGFGAFVQVVDPESPRALASWYRADARRPRDNPPQSWVGDVAFSDDGRFAYAAGSTEQRAANGRWMSERPQLVRLDLSRGKQRPLPDLRLEWAVQPAIERIGADAIRFTGTLRVVNAGRGAVATARVDMSLSDDAIADDADEGLDSRTTGRIAAGGSKLIRYESATFSGTPPRTFGRRLIAIANPRDRLPETHLGDAVAVSRPFEE